MLRWERKTMNLEGKIIGGRYQILEKVGNRRYGNSI
jgi:hypothetical protein